MFKDFQIDVFGPRLRVQNQKKALQELSRIAGPVCGAGEDTLFSVFDKRLSEHGFGWDSGVSVLDVASRHIVRPVVAVVTFEDVLDFNALDGRPVDILGAVISPDGDVPTHLQKLSWLSRVLRNEKLCGSLRSAKDEDAMRVLFLPSQDWFVAA